jgi:hypothetical protein
MNGSPVKLIIEKTLLTFSDSWVIVSDAGSCYLVVNNCKISSPSVDKKAAEFMNIPYFYAYRNLNHASQVSSSKIWILPERKSNQGLNF